eukprot:297113_1
MSDETSNQHTEHCIQSIKHDVFSGLGDLLLNNDCHDDEHDEMVDGDTFMDKMLADIYVKRGNYLMTKGEIESFKVYLFSDEYDSDAIRYDLFDVADNKSKSNIFNYIKNIQCVNFIINYIDDIDNKGYKTQFDLLTECTNCRAINNKIDVYNNCESIKRIIIILRGYNKIIENKLIGEISICDTLKFKNIYTLTQIHDDFIHIKEHIDTEIHPQLRQKFRHQFKSTTYGYRRLNNRHRSRNHISTKLKSIEDIVFQQTCDKIIAYLTHLDFDIEYPEIKANGKGKTYAGRIEDENWCNFNINNCVSKLEQDDAIYSQLVQKMGIFRWQNCHGFTSKQYQGLMHLKSKYKNIKEE